MNESASPVIETSDLTKSYKGVHALQSLDLRVPKNSIFAFLGPNGAGKTTTILFYSTHILGDVQRVSDMVAILDGGRLIAQASIEELLAGSGAAYLLLVQGDARAAQVRLAVQPWITSIQATPINGCIFLLFNGIAVLIAVVIAGQDAIIGEKQAGTAALVLSKPVLVQLCHHDHRVCLYLYSGLQSRGR
ncbi:MAG: hypothetical protein JW934_24140 [Anaerolineae bacterium]|nr:hypothetical protein [Anaerolineae bacterium]